MRSRNGQLFLLHRRWMKLEDLKILNECTQPAENERLEIRLWTMAWAVGLLSSFFSLFFTLNGFNCFSEEQHYSHITTCTERECEARSSPAINNLFSLLQETSRKKSPRRWHTYTKTFFSAVLLSHKHTLFNLSFLTNISHFLLYHHLNTLRSTLRSSLLDCSVKWHFRELLSLSHICK